MTSLFLAALQAKAQQINTTRETETVQQARAQKDVPIPLDVLQQSPQAAALDARLRNVGVPIAPASDLPTAPSVRIEIVTNRNRIDLFFSDIPSEDIRRMLKNRGFRFRNDGVPAWYHQDNLSNRAFLNAEFDAGISLGSDNGKAPDAEVVATPETVAHAEASPEFEKFRVQTNELIAHLSCEPADLMLIAIDALHKQTFSRDS